MHRHLWVFRRIRTGELNRNHCANWTGITFDAIYLPRTALEVDYTESRAKDPKYVRCDSTT